MPLAPKWIRPAVCNTEWVESISAENLRAVILSIDNECDEVNLDSPSQRDDFVDRLDLLRAVQMLPLMTVSSKLATMAVKDTHCWHRIPGSVPLKYKYRDRKLLHSLTCCMIVLRRHQLWEILSEVIFLNKYIMACVHRATGLHWKSNVYRKSGNEKFNRQGE